MLSNQPVLSACSTSARSSSRPDQTQKRQQYEEQVIRTFFLSHADATEMAQLLIGIIRVAGMAIQPQIVAQQDHQHASPCAPPRR